MAVLMLVLAALALTTARSAAARAPLSPRSVPEPVQLPVPVVRSISAGFVAGMAVTTSGQVYAWGATHLPSRPGVSLPAPVRGLSSISSVAASRQQFLALRSSGSGGGSTLGWGRNWFGSLGPLNDNQEPAPMGFDGVVDVAATADVSFAVTADGHVLAVGQDGFGGLGNGEPGVDSSAPVLVTDASGVPLANIVQVAGTGQCNLARDSAGRVWQWGTNFWCFGSGGFSAKALPEFGPSNPARQVAAGGQTQSALTGDGRVWTWGSNPLPNYPGAGAPPHPITGLSDVVRIGNGVAVNEDGTVWAWGFNDHGQVGLPADNGFYNPRQIAGLTHVIDVSGVGNWSMALKDDGTVWAWGDGLAGQLGNGVLADSPTPVQVQLPPVATAGSTFLATGLFQPGVPARLVDTRTDGSTLSAGETLTVPVAGRAGVPAVASAVWLNVTATNETGDGYLTVYPCDQPRPVASNVNYQAGIDVPNAVAAPLAADGSVCIYSYAGADVVVDVNGSFGTTGYAFKPLTPARLADTRSGGRLDDNAVLRVQVAGQSGVPADSAAAMVNVTATGAAGAGYLTVYPCDQPRPQASNVNYRPGVDSPNAVAVRLAADGSACVFALTATDVVVDVNGYLGTTGSILSAVVPTRLADTRATARLEAGGVLTVPVTGHAGVAQGASGAMLNVTATGAAAPGYLTVYPCDQARPVASNVNYRPGVDTPNAVAAPLAADGTTCIYSLQATDVIVDISGYFQ